MATSSNASQARGVVSSLQGKAWVVNDQGLRVELKPGDSVDAGQKVITEDGAQLELGLPNGQTISVAAGRELLIDTNLLGTAPVDATEAVINSLNGDAATVANVLANGGDLTDVLDPTAAGLTGGDSNGAHGFVRLLRIQELLSPLGINRDGEGGAFEQPQNFAARTTSTSVVNVQEGPTATPSTSSGNEDTNIAVALAGTDPDGTVASVKVTVLPPAAQGVLYLADGTTAVTTTTALTPAQAATLVFTPASNFNGTVTVSFTVTDNEGNTSTAANEVITIVNVNDAPTTTPVTLTAIAEDSGARVITAAELLGNSADVENNTRTVSNVTIASGSGSLVNNGNGTWSYTPAANDDTSVSFNYTITDNGTTNGVADPKSVAGSATLDITPVNDAPTTSAVTLTAIAEDSGARVITAAELLGNSADVENNTRTVSNVTIASGSGSLVNNGNGTWSYTPAANDDTSVSFNYTITDNGTTNGVADPKSVAGSATLDITPVNDAPVAVLDTGALKEDDTLTVTAPNGLLKNDTDPDAGDTRSVSRITQGANSSAVGASAGSLTSAYGTLTVNSDGSYSYIANGATSQSLKNGATAVDTFSYTLKDAAGLTFNTTLALTITGTNDTPTASPFTPVTQNDATAVFLSTAPNFADKDVGDVLTYSATGLPPGLSINALTGDITGTLTSGASQGGAAGKYTIQVTANDGTKSVSQPLTFTVLNPPPVAGNDTGLVNKGSTVTVSAGEGVISSGTQASGRDLDPDGDTLTVTGVRTGLESSADGSTTGTVGSVLHGLYGDLTLNSNGSYSYVANYAGIIARGTFEVDTFTYTVSDSQGGTDTAQLSISVYGTNTNPVARDDSNAASEDNVIALNVTASNGVIQSGATVGGKDSDADLDALQVVGVRTGAEAATGTAGSLNAALAGAYGSLTLRADGSYQYTLANSSTAVQNLAAGQVVQDVFTYTVSDGNGGFDTATLSINVTGSQDLTAGPPVITPLPPGVGGTATGLNGEYYGYNDSTNPGAGKRTHSDDGLAKFGLHGNVGNLNSVEDVYQIIDGRNQLAAPGVTVVGTSNTAAGNAADVSFQARTLDYGFNPLVNSSLGSNAARSAGTALATSDGNANSATVALSNFLDQDQSTALVRTGMGNTNNTSGLGTTTDAIVRLSGKFYVQPGQYDFRVTADDGFRLQVAGQTLLEFDGNQAPTTRVFTNVPLGDLGGGLQSLELLYWEQGGNAQLKVEYKASNDLNSAYKVMSLSNTPLFSNESAPVLTDTRIQDLVYDAATSAWQLRTGAKLDGDSGNNTITGGVSRDFLSGGDGNDTLIGLAGADTLDGGIGNDALNGGDGNDLLIGGSGTNSLTGEKGDDFYRLSSLTDSITEKAGEGYDSVQLDTPFIAGFSAANGSVPYVLGANLENLSAYGVGAINLTGNSAANRIEGNSASNAIVGGTGNDYIAGGGGSDTLTGDTGAKNQPGSDVFAWHLGDGGTTVTPAADIITDFNFGYNNSGARLSGQGNDVLDLRDLLVGEHTSVGDTSTNASMATISNLLNYIRVEVKGSDTLMHISTTGGMASTGTDFSKQDQTITLQNVNLYTDTGVTSGNESVLLQTLLKRGSLIVD